MLKVTDRLDRITIAAGEPFIMGIRFRDKDSDTPVDMTDRRFALVFYFKSGRGEFDTIAGVPMEDASGPYFAFVRDGVFSEILRGQGLKVDLVERLLNGHETIASASLTVSDLASGVVTYGSMIGHVESRFTIYLDDNGVVVLPARQSQMRYRPNGQPPSVITPAAISSDGTPQVGEQGLGIDPVFANASITTRGWYAGDALLQREKAITFPDEGDLIWRVDGIGTTGISISSQSTITVSAASPPEPITILQPLTLSTTEATAGQPYTATVAPLYDGSEYLQRVQDDRDGVSIAGGTLSGTFASVVPDITITEALYAKTAERGTVTVQAPSGIVVSVGAIVSAAEGNPSAGITVAVGAIINQAEGN